MRPRSKDGFWTWVLAVGIVLVVGGISLYVLQREPAPEPTPVVEEAPPPPPAPGRAPAPVVPPEPPLARTLPLPPLDESDADVRGGLTELIGPDAVMQFLVPERIVRNIVVTIDNLPREQLAVNQRPITPTPGEFVTSGPEDALELSPANYERYAPFIAIVRELDAKTLVAFYEGLRPLFQQAYEELGHPNSAFDARLIEVIDHLLAAEPPPAQLRLVQPSVHYKFADERLEKLSAGHKLLLRMGPDNAAVLKSKLREIRAELL